MNGTEQNTLSISHKFSALEMTDRAPPGPSAPERQYKINDIVEYLDSEDNRWKEATIVKLWYTDLDIVCTIWIRITTGGPKTLSNLFITLQTPFDTIRPLDAGDNNHDDLLVGSLQMPKFALPTFKTPSVFKRSAPPTEKDGVPAHLVKYFQRIFDNQTVHRLWDRGSRDYYGILTRGGKKYYFMLLNGRPDGSLEIKLCPTDTSSKVVIWNTEPNNIKNWTAETLTRDQQLKDDVFWIKDPTDYFAFVKMTQNIWPIDKAPVKPVSVSQSFSNEGNPYFI